MKTIKARPVSGYKYIHEAEGSHYELKFLPKINGTPTFPYGPSLSRRAAFRQAQNTLDEFKKTYYRGTVKKEGTTEIIEIPGIGIGYGKVAANKSRAANRRFQIVINDFEIGKLRRTTASREDIVSAWTLITELVASHRGFDKVPEEWVCPSETYLVRLLDEDQLAHPDINHVDHNGVLFEV